MIYFVTGASGFIGKRLVRTLLSRSQATVYFLMRDLSPGRSRSCANYWHASAKRAIPVKGDINNRGSGFPARTSRRSRIGWTISSILPRSTI